MWTRDVVVYCPLCGKRRKCCGDHAWCGLSSCALYWIARFVFLSFIRHMLFFMFLCCCSVDISHCCLLICWYFFSLIPIKVSGQNINLNQIWFDPYTKWNRFFLQFYASVHLVTERKKDKRKLHLKFLRPKHKRLQYFTTSDSFWKAKLMNISNCKLI